MGLMLEAPDLVGPCGLMKLICGQVLRFHCYWDDRLALYGDMRLFTLYYYLADDSIEVVEVLPWNCGRDPVPHMLRRMRLPKHPGPVGGSDTLCFLVICEK